jgi:chromosomal replication initiation ATPase DnaA
MTDGLGTARRLLAEVCRRHRVGPRSIYSTCRISCVVMARHELIWLLRQVTTWPTTEIGCYMGMHHTSIIHAIKKHELRRAARK